MEGFGGFHIKGIPRLLLGQADDFGREGPWDDEGLAQFPIEGLELVLEIGVDEDRIEVGVTVFPAGDGLEGIETGDGVEELVVPGQGHGVDEE